MILDDIKRFWLHQANGNMINFVAKKLKGEDYDPNAAPMILEKYGNVASAGSVIAFHETKDDFRIWRNGCYLFFWCRILNMLTSRGEGLIWIHQ